MIETAIKKAKALKFRARLNCPFRTSLGQHDTLENVLFMIELQNGIRGFGEAAIATHITGETFEGTLENLKKVAHSLSGKDSTKYLDLCLSLRERLSNNHSALAAAEMAILDALTQYLEIPLWRFFGNRSPKLTSDITIVISSIDEARDFARNFYKRGFRSFKIKIGKDRDEDLKRVLAVSGEVRNSSLLLDANQGFTARETIHFLKDLKRHRVIPRLIEQPVSKHDWEGLRKVTRDCKNILVLADESASSLSEAIKIIHGNYASAINIKFMKTGIFESYKIAKLAQAKNIKLMIGAMMESPLATVSSAHFAGGLGGFDFIDLDTPYFIKDRVTKGYYPEPNGVYDLKKIKAGIGVTPIL